MIFVEREPGTWSGTDDRGREWRVMRVRSGWRLQFLDKGAQAINAGVFATLEAAQRDAAR